MSETLNNMKDAVVGGRGGGLQSTSTAIGDSIAENTNAAQSNSSKKADEASASLGEFGKGSAGPTSDGPVKAEKQMENQSTGSADHLNLDGK